MERRRLPETRQSHTHHFTILAVTNGQPEEVGGYLTIGFYDDGSVGEIFCRLSKQGSNVSGFVDAWAIAFSLLLQIGMPLADLIHRFRGFRFEPSGRIKGSNMLALSPIDYICRYLERFLPVPKETEQA